MENYSDDIRRARETQESIEYFRNKYTLLGTHDLRRIADVLEIAEQYDIPIDKMRLSSFGRILLLGKTGC